jgi:hypothetical protein
MLTTVVGVAVFPNATAECSVVCKEMPKQVAPSAVYEVSPSVLRAVERMA